MLVMAKSDLGNLKDFGKFQIPLNKRGYSKREKRVIVVKIPLHATTNNSPRRAPKFFDIWNQI
jgi:hypothetical protein